MNPSSPRSDPIRLHAMVLLERGEAELMRRGLALLLRGEAESLPLLLRTLHEVRHIDHLDGDCGGDLGRRDVDYLGGAAIVKRRAELVEVLVVNVGWLNAHVFDLHDATHQRQQQLMKGRRGLVQGHVDVHTPCSHPHDPTGALDNSPAVVLDRRARLRCVHPLTYMRVEV